MADILYKDSSIDKAFVKKVAGICKEDKPDMMNHIMKGSITALLAILSFFLIATFTDLKETMKSVSTLNSDVSAIRVEVDYLVKSVDKIDQTLENQALILQEIIKK